MSTDISLRSRSGVANVQTPILVYCAAMSRGFVASSGVNR